MESKRLGEEKERRSVDGDSPIPLLLRPQPSARDENLRSSWGCTPKPASLTGPLSTPSIRASEMDEATLMSNLLGDKLGLLTSSSGRPSSSSRSSSSDDESFIRTPPTGPMLPSLAMTPEMSPPPSYDSLSLPPLPSGGFSLPPPAMSMRKDDNNSPSNFSSTSGESKTVILYVGRISWEKNLRLLIEAFRLLPSSVKSSAKLVFVGDGPARGELTRLCSKLGLDASFMGHQKGTRLAAMYASSSVFAFPSFTETFGQVVLEALASGLPVVGLHAEGTSDLVTHGRTGLLLDVVSATKNASANARENAAAAKENASRPNSPALKASFISDFATAATTATRSYTSSPLAMRALQSSSSSSGKFSSSSQTSGLSTPIPTVGAFASSMSTSSPAFAACSRRYSMLLERLIRDRTLRATMGQRALDSARSKTWWEAMEKAVNGYEEAIRKRGAKNLTDDELEEIRGKLKGKELLTGEFVVEERASTVSLTDSLSSFLFIDSTGPATKLAVLLYLILFLYIWHILLH